ncbi:MAG: hypothetical protein H0T99_02940, partial [Geodermatophilaceae bacterium]|nr:hypothetical protein [Geodermatophilaceae bacterium]
MVAGHARCRGRTGAGVRGRRHDPGRGSAGHSRRVHRCRPVRRRQAGRTRGSDRQSGRRSGRRDPGGPTAGVRRGRPLWSDKPRHRRHRRDARRPPGHQRATQRPRRLRSQRRRPCRAAPRHVDGRPHTAPAGGADHVRTQGGDVHFIDSIESSQALRVVNRLGRSMPAHCTPTGKALLATLSEPELLAAYPDEELVQLTRHSIGTSQEESEEGVQSLAVALRAVGSPRLALCAS